jgi:hypothetical protein
MEKNYVYFKFEPIINASKSKEYKAPVTKNCTALMNFLISNDLLNINPLNEDGIIKEDLVLTTKEFKNSGELLFGKPVMKWLQYLDKGGSIDNLKILQKGLDDIRATSTK